MNDLTNGYLYQFSFFDYISRPFFIFTSWRIGYKAC